MVNVKRYGFFCVIFVTLPVPGLADDVSGHVGFEKQRVGGISTEITSAGIDFANVLSENSLIGTEGYWSHNKDSDTLHAGLTYVTPVLPGLSTAVFNASLSKTGINPDGLTFEQTYNTTTAYSASYDHLIWRSETHTTVNAISGATYVRSVTPFTAALNQITKSWSGRLGMRASHSNAENHVTTGSVTLMPSTSKTEQGGSVVSKDRSMSVDLSASYSRSLWTVLTLDLEADVQFSPDGTCVANTSIYGHYMHNTPKTGYECHSAAAKLSYDWRKDPFDLVPYVFFDYGEIVGADHVSDGGFGLNFSMAQNVTGLVEYTRGLNNSGDANDTKDNFDFQIQVSF